MMPLIHDAFWIGVVAALAALAWKMADRFNLRVPAFDLRRTFGPGEETVGATAPGTWFQPPRSSGNTAFDAWRDRELARLEDERQALEAKLHAFEAFVDKLRRAKDRETYDQFMASFRDLPEPVSERVANTDVTV